MSDGTQLEVLKGKQGEQWLKIWIKDWREVVNARYPYAINMANSRSGEMDTFLTISDNDIDDLLFYFNQAEIKIISPSITSSD